MDHAIDIRQLTVAYGAKPVLWNVDLQIPKDGMTGIVGPNGAGKSTLIKAILGTVPTLSGEIKLHEEVSATSDSIGYGPQRSSVDWDFPTTVFDLAMMGTYGRLKWFRRPGAREREQTWEALRQVRMEDFADRQIGELSGGQQQRLFIARAFVQQAQIYLMDEPFAGVDAKTETLLIEILHTLRDQGNTIVLVHHDLTTVADYFDHVVLLDRQIIASGKTSETFTSENIEATYGVAGMQVSAASGNASDD
ncbi:MAG: metal ABC transporter ATP-binding protein [Planctomycetota bacterium]